jgi:hypothetical protein
MLKNHKKFRIGELMMVLVISKPSKTTKKKLLGFMK